MLHRIKAHRGRDRSGDARPGRPLGPGVAGRAELTPALTASGVDRTILITGGAGFVGSAVAARLVAGGDRVRVLDDLSIGSLAYLRGVRSSSSTAPSPIGSR